MEALPTSLITRMFNDIQVNHDPRAKNARHYPGLNQSHLFLMAVKQTVTS